MTDRDYGKNTDTAFLMSHDDYVQMHGVTAALPSFAEPGSDWTVAKGVKRRIEKMLADDNGDDVNAKY